MSQNGPSSKFLIFKSIQLIKFSLRGYLTKYDASSADVTTDSDAIDRSYTYCDIAQPDRQSQQGRSKAFHCLGRSRIRHAHSDRILGGHSNCRARTFGSRTVRRS